MQIKYPKENIYAQKDYEMNQNRNAKSKMKQSENITLIALTHAIKVNLPNLILEFVEHNNATNRSYPVDMTFDTIKFIDKERVVFKGYLDMPSSIPSGVGTIEYNFSTGQFYRVSYSDKTTRSRRLHSLIVHNKDVVNDLLTFISNYLYSTEDNEHTVDVNGPTPSKVH